MGGLGTSPSASKTVSQETDFASGCGSLLSATAGQVMRSLNEGRRSSIRDAVGYRQLVHCLVLTREPRHFRERRDQVLQAMPHELERLRVPRPRL